MMFSIKPLEWSGRSSNGKIHKAYVVPMEYWAWENAGFGYWSWGSLAGREVYGGLDGAKAAAQADYESRIFSALSSPPAAAESNASAEARLRERVHFYRNHSDAPVYSGKHVANILETVFALSSRATYNKPAYPNELCNYSGPCGWKDEARFKHFAPDGGKAPIRPDAPNHLTIKTSAELAIAVGDEAKESEGVVESGVAPLETRTALVGETEIGRMTTEQPEKMLRSESRLVPPSRTAGVAPGPSDPTADRREIVARCIIGPRLPVPEGSPYTLEELREIKWNNASRAERYDALNAADAILAALDGGAGA